MKNPEFNQDLLEWLEALENTILTDGEEYTSELLQQLFQEAKTAKRTTAGLSFPLISSPVFFTIFRR